MAAPASIVKDGYTFTGWSYLAENVVSNLTIEAEYEKISIAMAVKYDMPSDDSDITVTDENGSLIAGIMLYTKKYKTALFLTEVTGRDMPVTWSSYDSSVVKVSSSGKITALKKGTATVTVSTGGVKRKVKVRVR